MSLFIFIGLDVFGWFDGGWFFELLGVGCFEGAFDFGSGTVVFSWVILLDTAGA